MRDETVDRNPVTLAAFFAIVLLGGVYIGAFATPRKRRRAIPAPAQLLARPLPDHPGCA